MEIYSESLFAKYSESLSYIEGTGAWRFIHAIGTAKAIEIGEIEGAMSSLAIAVAGILTVVFASVFANFY